MIPTTLLHRFRIGLLSLFLISLTGCSLAYFHKWHEKKEPPTPKITISLGDGITMDFVLVSSGSFTMGSNSGDRNEKPVHVVTFENPFYLSRHPVTEEQWQKVMKGPAPYFSDLKMPKTGVTWYECQKFVTKLNEFGPGQTFCLPSEAQWEYACRAGKTDDFAFTEGVVDLARYGWFKDNSGGVIHPVGLKRKNAWGLYDMHGNIWEWCQDLAHDSYDGAPIDGSAWIKGTNDTVRDHFRIIRGGSATDDAESLRCSKRSHFLPDHASGFVGLRVAIMIESH